MLLSDIFTNNPHLQIHKSAEFFGVFFLLWFKGSAPHVCSNKSSIPDVMSAGDWLYGARAQTPALAHTRAQTFLRVFKLLLELKLRARELSRLLDSRFPRFPFRALKLSFTPSIFPLF